MTGVRLPTGAWNFIFATAIQAFWGSPSLLSSEYEEVSPPEVKRLERKSDHSPSSTDEDKND